MQRPLGWVLVIIALALPVEALAQPHIEALSDPNVTRFEQVQAAADAWFAQRGTKRGSGYKQYKRWEWFMEPRVYPSGELFNPAARAKDTFDAYKASPAYAAQSAQIPAPGAFTTQGPECYALGALGTSGGLGRVNALAFDLANRKNVYAGAAGGGVWQTTVQGNAWTPQTDDLTLLGVSSLAFDSVDPTWIYMLSGDGDGRNTPSVGLYRSKDKGANWELTSLTWPRTDLKYGYKVAAHPSDYEALLVAMDDGLYRSINAADTWTKVANGNFRDVEFAPNDETIAYASTTTGVYRSTDKGVTWTAVTNGLPAYSCPAGCTCGNNCACYNRVELAVTRAAPSTVYALYGAQPCGFGGLYRSTDLGVTFTKQSDAPNILGYAKDGSDQLSISGYALAIASPHDDADVINVGSVNTWKSTDAGKTWTNTSYWVETEPGSQYTHADIHDLAYDDSNTLFCASDGGVFVSRDKGTNWSDISSGLVITQIYELACSKNAPAALYFGSQDNGSNLLDPVKATQIWGGDGMYALINPTNANIIYVTNQNGKLLRSADAGAHLAVVSPGGTCGNDPNKCAPTCQPCNACPDCGGWVTPFELHPSTPTTVYGCYKDLWRSTNEGTNWTNVSAGHIGDGPCVAMKVAPSNPSNIYVAKANKVFFSFDAGATWIDVTTNLPVASAAISDITVSTRAPDNAWVSFSGYADKTKVFFVDHVGGQWTNFTGTLPNLPANSLAYDDEQHNGLYVGMDVGVYFRDLAMNGWVLYNGGLPNAVVNDVVVNSATHKVMAATYGRGVWQSDLYTAAAMHQVHDERGTVPSGRTRLVAREGIDSRIVLDGSRDVDLHYLAGRRVTLSSGFRVHRGSRLTISVGKLPPRPTRAQQPAP